MQRRSVALFGGTFDPIHAGHIAVAQAAQKRFHLDAIYFIPSARPPHKTKLSLTPFVHRYAMVALACADHASFVPSIAEAEMDGAPPHVYYTIDTVRRFHRDHPPIIFTSSWAPTSFWSSPPGKITKRYWMLRFHHRQPSRFQARCAAPGDSAGKAGARETASNAQTILLRKSAVHLLTTVSSHVSSTEIRDRLDEHKSIHGLVPERVEEYIQGQALYR